MRYFTEITDYQTYQGEEADFHFNYNANAGGGQSRLGGKFYDANGNLSSPILLNGRVAIFAFSTSNDIVQLADPIVEYEIKPRSEGDSNMKLGVGSNRTPSEAITAFLMLPEPCGVKKSADVNTSVLNGNNYWVQSMWLSVDTTNEGKAIFTPKDCIVCGGVDKQGQGSARYFAVDFRQRISDIIQLAGNSSLEGDVLSCVKHFADIYSGNKPFAYEESAAAIKAVMKYLSTKYPEQYSGTLDPLSFIQELSHSSPPPVKQLGPRQKIVYGAPGTGKSWSVKRETQGKSVIRTTFHPDSDYSTFVGAYKPSMETDEYDTVVTTGEKTSGGTISKKDGLVRQKRIVYKFVAQAFLEAYVEAWRKCAAFLSAQDDNAKNVATQFLVIEEINRGNCAQIFGDIFQLLDREDDGYSSYAIKSDTDLCQYLKEAFGGNAKEGIAALDLTGVNFGDRDVTPNEIKSGKKMLLPPNMFIRATMNTSDQSLFPIDSAFKRRWDWRYVPILEGRDEHTNQPLEWKIAFDIVKKVGGQPDTTEPFEFDWWEFIKRVNKVIGATTNSEDKKLGYFFVKAERKSVAGNEIYVVTAEKLLEKVIFYLWNDVFKDYGLDKIFAKGGKPVEYCQFYDRETGAVDRALVKEFVESLPVVKDDE